MAKKKINYDNLNKQKENHKLVVKNIENELAKEKEKNAKLKAENKALRKELFDATNRPGALKDKDSKIKKLESKISTLEAKIALGDDPYYCFNENERALIKKIKNLEYEGQTQIYNDILDKFKQGTDVLLSLARKCTKGNVNLRDIYIYTFRDSLICLLEKSLQCITFKMSNRGISAILKAAVEHYDTYIEKIDATLIEEAPLLTDPNTFKNLELLVKIENTAFHGSVIDYKRSNAKSQTESNDETARFLKMTKESQLKILFTLIEFLYQLFNSSSKEMILLMIDQCWIHRYEGE